MRPPGHQVPGLAPGRVARSRQTSPSIARNSIIIVYEKGYLSVLFLPLSFAGAHPIFPGAYDLAYRNSRIASSEVIGFEARRAGIQ